MDQRSFFGLEEQLALISACGDPLETLERTVDFEGAETILEGRGRHDPCVVPRAVPIVEGMAALVIADMLLLQKTRERGLS